MFFLFFFPSRFALSSIFLGGRGDWGAHGALQILGKMELRKADDIRTKHAFVWGDLNARNPVSYTHLTLPTNREV